MYMYSWLPSSNHLGLRDFGDKISKFLPKFGPLLVRSGQPRVCMRFGRVIVCVQLFHVEFHNDCRAEANDGVRIRVCSCHPPTTSYDHDTYRAMMVAKSTDYATDIGAGGSIRQHSTSPLEVTTSIHAQRHERDIHTRHQWRTFESIQRAV